MGGAIVAFALLPWLDRSEVRSCRFRPVWKWCVWVFVSDFFLLMYVGAMPAEGIYVLLGQIGTFYWFAFLFLLAPLVPFFENTKQLPASINQYVKLRKKK